MTDKPLLTIGKITGVHGLNGNLKVWSFAESIDTFAAGRTVLVSPEDTLGQAGDRMEKAYTILKSSARKKGILLTLKGVDNRHLAEELVGYEILIHRDELPELDEDTWYWEDLYGLEVVDRDKGRIGIIERIFPTGANDVLVVKDRETGKETLIPMHRHFVDAVDMPSKTVRTILPEGY